MTQLSMSAAQVVQSAVVWVCASLQVARSMCRFQQLTAYDQDLPGDSIKVVNAHGSCLSPLNITARSLTAADISAVAPQQWQNFTWATSSRLLRNISCCLYMLNGLRHVDQSQAPRQHAMCVFCFLVTAAGLLCEHSYRSNFF